MPTLAHVDLEELTEALRRHYAGTLNYVPAENANRPLEALEPGKPLLSQLTSEDIAKAFESVSPADEAIIEYFSSDDVIALEPHSENNQACFSDALIRLGEVVAAQL